MKYTKISSYTLATIMLLATFTFLLNGGVAMEGSGTVAPNGAPPPADPLPATGWNVVEHDTPVGDSFFNFETFGGWWSDAEKSPSDTEDDDLCWAATLANIMEYTGWGYVGGMDTPDETLDYIGAHTLDLGTTIDLAFQWWVTGVLPVPGPGWSEEDVEGGGFWPAYDWSVYTHVHDVQADMMEYVEYNLAGNRGTGLWIVGVGGVGSHEITCWGVDVDTGVFDNSRWKGVWVSDSDSHKGDENAEDHLTYFSVAYDEGGGYWYLPNYGSGWKIIQVVGIDMFPGELRPMANVQIPHNGGEGSSVFFTAGGSDPDGDSMSYRWDWNGDGKWDTEWSQFSIAQHSWEDEYSGTVYVQVFDGRLATIDGVEVVVENVAPTVDLSMDTYIDENDDAVLVMTLTEPGVLDTLELEVDWGDGTPLQTISVMLGSTVISAAHHYPDDDPTGTLWDRYTISVAVEDNDGGVGSDSIILTVKTVEPVVSIDSMAQPDPFFILPLVHELIFYGSFTDVGLLDTHTVTWDWGDGIEESVFIDNANGAAFVQAVHTYAEPGTYTVTLTVTDDDGAKGHSTMLVEVVTATEALEKMSEHIQSLSDQAFKKNADQRMAVLGHKIEVIQHQIEVGSFKGAMNHLQNDVRDKMDGSMGGKSNNDWIVDPVAQAELTQMIDDICAYLYLTI